MSLSVKHINGDSTFLLTFSSTDLCETPDGYTSTPGTFTVLLDPWITGDSFIYHPKFALAKRTIPSCISHLSEIPPPNVVIVSQDRTDHCHEDTLRQLDPSLRHTVILAHPAAAKKIRGWKFFNPTKVHSMPIFAERKPHSMVRFHLPCPIPGATPGEVTISLVDTKRDITGLHNAIGITYTGPSFSTAIGMAFSTPESSASAVDLSSHRPPLSPYLETLPPTPPESPRSRSYSDTSSSTTSPPPDSLFGRPTTSSRSSALSSHHPHTYAPFRPKTLSVIYSPHGITYPALVPYVTSHLISKAALPLTLLLHSFDRVQNPWYLGGNINAGMPGGLEIAQSLLAKCWISAHDEDKEQSGLGIMKCVTRKHTVEEVRVLVQKGRKGGREKVDVRALECGEEVWLGV